MKTYVPLLSASLWILASCSGGSDYTDDMAREHADDAPISNQVSDGLPAPSVVTETVTYATVDGEAVEGYLARPEGAEGPLPGIVVIHEWWGLNDNIRSMADQLAGEGYQALAVDLYDGQVASDRDMAAQLMSGSMEKSDALTENLKQAFAYLEGDGQKVGTIAWCFGGGWLPWCTTRDLGPQLSCTHGFEVPHEHFQTHSAEVCEEGLSREELA